MGACLPKAVESVVIERHGHESFRVGVAEMNGWRNSMEDAHLVHMLQDWAFFGVFDGHSGDQCSKFVAPRIGEILQREVSSVSQFHYFRLFDCVELVQGCPTSDRAIKDLILRVDHEFLETRMPSGSTATMCIVQKPTMRGACTG